MRWTSTARSSSSPVPAMASAGTWCSSCSVAVPHVVLPRPAFRIQGDEHMFRDRPGAGRCPRAAQQEVVGRHDMPFSRASSAGDVADLVDGRLLPPGDNIANPDCQSGRAVRAYASQGGDPLRGRCVGSEFVVCAPRFCMKAGPAMITMQRSRLITLSRIRTRSGIALTLAAPMSRPPRPLDHLYGRERRERRPPPTAANPYPTPARARGSNILSHGELVG